MKLFLSCIALLTIASPSHAQGYCVNGQCYGYTPAPAFTQPAVVSGFGAVSESFSVTEHYPGGWQQVGAWSGPLGIFGGPIVAPQPPRTVTRTYQAAPVVIESVGIVEERVTYSPWTGRYRTTRFYRGR